MNSVTFRTAVRGALVTRMAAHGLSDFEVLSEYQPTSQGRDRDAVYFFTVSENRHGWQGRRYRAPEIDLDGSATEVQVMQTVVQFGAYVVPGQPFAAVDLVESVAMIVNSLAFATDCRAQGIGVQRVTNVRTPYFKNESDRFEMSPSFDVTFNYRRTLSPVVEFLETLQPAIHRV